MMNEYVVVSNQISSDELFEIVKNTKKNLIVDTLGMACCFYSKRPLITNYLKFKDYKLKKYRSEVMKLKEETRDNFYHIVEDVNGTKVYEEAAKNNQNIEFQCVAAEKYYKENTDKIPLDNHMTV